jgi:hypothetical protein
VDELQEGKQLWTGPCIGGPLGSPGSPEGQSRFPLGFLYVDKPNCLAWLYRWSELDGKFFVENEEPFTCNRESVRVYANNAQWDIRTAEPEVSNGYKSYYRSARSR